MALCPPSPLVASPAPKFAPLTASLRCSERGQGVSTFRSPPGAGAWRPALTLEAATLPPSPHRVPLSPPAPLDSGATRSWPLGERPSPGGNAQRLSIWAAQTVSRSGRAWGQTRKEQGWTSRLWRPDFICIVSACPERLDEVRPHAHPLRGSQTLAGSAARLGPPARRPERPWLARRPWRPRAAAPASSVPGWGGPGSRRAATCIFPD